MTTGKYSVHAIDHINGRFKILPDAIAASVDLSDAQQSAIKSCTNAAGGVGPYGGAVLDASTGMWDAGNGWQSLDDAETWLSTPEG